MNHWDGDNSGFLSLLMKLLAMKNPPLLFQYKNPHQAPYLEGCSMVCVCVLQPQQGKEAEQLSIGTRSVKGQR